MRKVILLLFLAVCTSLANAQLTVTPGDTTICAGDSVSYTASGMTILGYADSLNNDTVLNANYTFTTTTPGTHSIAAFGINFVPQDTDTVIINITVNPAPMASILSSGGNLICEGSSSELVAPSTIGATYLWSPASALDTTGTDTVMASPDSTTTFNLLVTDSNGCTGEDALTIEVNPMPSVSIISSAEGNNNFVCEGDTAILTADADSSVVSYEWSPTGTLSDSNTISVVASPNNSTTYTLLVTDSNGCTASSTVQVGVNDSPPTIVFVPSEASICEGSSIFIQVLSTGDEFSWTPTATVEDSTAQSTTLSPTVTTEYTYTAKGNGCVSVDNITVTVLPAPSLTLAQSGGNNPLCLDEVAELTVTCPLCDSYTWTLPNSTLTTTATVQNISPNEPGPANIVVTGVDTVGCGSSDSVVLNVDSCYVGDPFAIEEGEAGQTNSLTVYNKSESIAFKATVEISALKLYNLLGEEIVSIQNNRSDLIDVDTKSLADGVYIVRAQLSNGELITEKIYVK